MPLCLGGRSQTLFPTEWDTSCAHPVAIPTSSEWDWRGIPRLSTPSQIRSTTCCSYTVVRQVPLCWHASQCPWHSTGRCLFRHRDADAGAKPPMTRTEEEIGVELAALWAAVSKVASSLMTRTGQCVDVPAPQVMEEPIVKQSCVLAGCGDGAEGSRVGVCGCPWSGVGGMTSTAEAAAGENLLLKLVLGVQRTQP